MDGRKVRMSDVPSKDCNGVLRMQVMIAKSGGSVVARYGPDRASARACIPVHDSHLPEANSDHDTQAHYPKQTTDTDVHTRSEISWKFLGLQRKIPRAEDMLPKIAALVFFAPWTFVAVVNNLPTDLRLQIQKSKFLQSGTKMRTVNKLEPPKVRGARLPTEAKELTESFKKTYAAKDLEILWGAMLKCYGSQEFALQAARANPTLINPSYSFCNTMLESKRVLLNKMGEEDALRVMLQNPAVLQCGPSLESIGPTEIKALAAVRGIGARLPKGTELVVFAALVSAVFLPVAGSLNPEFADSELLAASKTVSGVFVAPFAAAAILYLLRAGGG
jgi:hypothetical protein